MDISSSSVAVVDNEEDTVNLFPDVIQINGYFSLEFTNPYFLLDHVRKHPDQLKLI